MAIQITEPARSTLAEAPTESTIEAVGPGEFHELDLKTWRCVIGCPRCLNPICLSHGFERTSGGVSLQQPFRCQVCGFASEVQGGEHREQPHWKPGPGQERLERIIQGNRQHFQQVRPDLDLPDVAKAASRWNR